MDFCQSSLIRNYHRGCCLLGVRKVTPPNINCQRTNHFWDCHFCVFFLQLSSSVKHLNQTYWSFCLLFWKQLNNKHIWLCYRHVKAELETTFPTFNTVCVCVGVSATPQLGAGRTSQVTLGLDGNHLGCDSDLSSVIQSEINVLN